MAGKTVLISGLLLIALQVGRAQGTEAGASLGECATELRLPAFSSLARSTNTPVTVDVRIHLDEAGHASALDFDGGEEGHHADIKIAIGESKFSRSCGGKVITVQFTYEIVGEPLEYPAPVVVLFHGPNRFVLRTHPVLPSIDRTRVPKD